MQFTCGHLNFHVMWKAEKEKEKKRKINALCWKYGIWARQMAETVFNSLEYSPIIYIVNLKGRWAKPVAKGCVMISFCIIYISSVKCNILHRWSNYSALPQYMSHMVCCGTDRVWKTCYSSQNPSISKEVLM